MDIKLSIFKKIVRSQITRSSSERNLLIIIINNTTPVLINLSKNEAKKLEASGIPTEG